MRESCTYGSVRGARGNSRPYRECGLLRLLTAAYGRFCCKSRREIVWTQHYNPGEQNVESTLRIKA